MNKRYWILALLALIALALPVLASAASSGTCGSNVSWRLDDSGLLTISGSGSMNNYDDGSFNPPPWDKGSVYEVLVQEGVTGIGEFAFCYCGNLTTVRIANTVTTIGQYAFDHCTSLSSIRLSSNLSEIRQNLFYGCSCLRSIVIPSSVREIGLSAFGACGLTSITIPGTVNVIGEASFNSCVGLTEVTIQNGVQTIAKQAFDYCRNLPSITLPNSVTVMGESAFSGCDGLTTVKLSSGLKRIETLAFADCHSLSSITIPSSITAIGDAAFTGCGNLSSIQIPSSVTSIGGSAFRYCGSLTSVTIPSGVTVISNNLFQECGSLTSVTFKGNVTTIGDHAFVKCTSLTDITLPASLTTIEMCAFQDCTSLTSIKLPSGLKTIGGSAFWNCSSLTSINIPDSVSSMGGGVFKGCSSLKTLKLPNSMTKIDDYAFEGFSSLTSLTLPSSLITIGKGAFKDCSGLTSLTIPSTVTSIGDEAFKNCGGLTSMTIPNGVKKIGDRTFDCCGGLESVSIPNTVTSIGSYAFSWCGNLPSIRLPSSVKTIGDNAFEWCKGLTSFTIPDSVTTLGKNAFRWCENLSSIRLSDSLTKIQQETFCWCKSLKSVTVPPSVTRIDDLAFKSCQSMTLITIPDSVTSFGSDVFYFCSGDLAINCTADSAAYQYARANGIYVNVVTFKKPTITTQPTSKTVNVGDKATFKVVASGDDLRYQWHYQKPDDSTWYLVSNSGTAATLTLTAATHHNGYKYRVKVSNSAGYVWSNTVTLTVTSGSKPTITTQPVNKKVNEGAKVTFKVVATGATAYQWYYKKPGGTTWNAVSNNGTSASYSLTTEARHNGYQYRVKVSNSVGAVYSNTVTLTVNLKPVITTQPANKTVNQGAKATFKVVATGATAYQWYYRKPGDSTWTAVKNNGTSATYTLTTEARHNGYKYRVKVSNSVGAVYSNTVTLTVASSAVPTITTQPVSKKVNEGAKVTFKVVATGATNYQWYYKKPGESIWNEVSTNGTSASYTLTTAARHNGYKYCCLVSNNSGSVWSETATLTLNLKPVITTQPVNKKVNEGAKATFKVVATGATSYQWYYKKPGETAWNEVNNNGTSASYTLTTEARHNGYKYCCLVSNSAGSVWSETATLTLNLKPVITSQPSSVTVTAGRTATFKVTATGATSYQWYYQKPGETTWTEVANNGTSATYKLTAAARHNGYKYRCKVTNSAGSVYTSIVTLRVN